MINVYPPASESGTTETKLSNQHNYANMVHYYVYTHCVMSLRVSKSVLPPNVDDRVVTIDLRQTQPVS